MTIERTASAVAPLAVPAGRDRPYAPILLAAMLGLTLLRLLWLAIQPADLYPDEAQYWVWAQQPALGYYSKPPLLAWLIAATTAAFGDGTFAIRASAPLLHAGAACFVYGIGARLYDRRTGFWSAIAYATLPGVSLSAFLIATDAPLLLFWAAALYAFVRAREARASPYWWGAVGVAAGLGLLSKYAMAYWLISALGYALICRDERRHWRGLLVAIGIAFLFYLPNLWWNATHGFVSYLHTRDNADFGGPLFHPNAFFEFLGSQFGVFGPLFFGLLLAFYAMPRFLAGPRERFLAAFALPTLTMMLAVSFLSRAHANWSAPTYVTASILVVSWLLRHRWRAALAAAVALHVAAALVLFGGRDALVAAGIQVPARLDPLHRLRGWREVGAAVGAALQAHPGLTLLADDRETLAALIYYVRPHPFDAAKWNPMRQIKDQWDLTNDLARHPGGNFLVVSEIGDTAEMRRSFRSVDYVGAVIAPIGPGMARLYTLYVARAFTGYPADRR